MEGAWGRMSMRPPSRSEYECLKMRFFQFTSEPALNLELGCAAVR